MNYIHITFIYILLSPIILNIPYLREIIGFLVLTILPGFLILRILKLDELEFTEKFVLSVGLSVSFVIFVGLFINNSLLFLGYRTPLAKIPLLFLVNISLLVLAILEYKVNNKPIPALPKLSLNSLDKSLLIFPIIFPALSVFGMYVMNKTANNLLLIILLLLIPLYVVIVCIFNRNLQSGIYPLIIFSVSTSLLLLMSLRSNHIIGFDIHQEFYLFQITTDNSYWSMILGYSTLDACLSISLMPAIYRSISDIPPELLYKILFSLLFSITPLILFLIYKKYVQDIYAFLASCFFMFQSGFLNTSANPRTSIAILFFALTVMILFNDNISLKERKILFIIFSISCVFSHYSTTFIFLFILIATFLITSLLSKKYSFDKDISLTQLILFFSFIFLWYSQITETPFIAGITFIEKTLISLGNFFVIESREGIPEMLGQGLSEKGIPHTIQFVWTWLSFALIGIGVAKLLINHKEMSSLELNNKKSELIKNKFDISFSIIALNSTVLLVLMVALPYISVGYDLYRLYSIAITTLSVFFVIGGIVVSKYVLFITNNESDNYYIYPLLIILIVLIPHFLCVSGVMYNTFGYSRGIILFSDGRSYDMLYVHDQESHNAKWLEIYSNKEKTIYADYYGLRRLMSQSKIPLTRISSGFLSNPERMNGYIYLRYQNIRTGELFGTNEIYDIIEYQDLFDKTIKIYDSGFSEVRKSLH